METEPVELVVEENERGWVLQIIDGNELLELDLIELLKVIKEHCPHAFELMDYSKGVMN